MCSRSGGATHTRARARTHTPFCPQSPRRGVLPGPKPAACASSAWRWGHKGRARHCRPPRAPRATRSRKEAYFTRQPPTRRAEANAGSASSREGSAVMVLGVGTLAKVVTRFARGKGVPSRSQRDEMAVPDVACETEMQGVDKRDEVRRGSQRVYRAGIYLPGGTEVRRLYPAVAGRTRRGGQDRCPGVRRGALGGVIARCARRAGLVGCACWGVGAGGAGARRPAHPQLLPLSCALACASGTPAAADGHIGALVVCNRSSTPLGEPSVSNGSPFVALACARTPPLTKRWPLDVLSPLMQSPSPVADVLPLCGAGHTRRLGGAPPGDDPADWAPPLQQRAAAG